MTKKMFDKIFRVLYIVFIVALEIIMVAGLIILFARG